MIQITLETTEFFAGQPNNLTIGLINNGQETLTNIVFGLKLPATIRLQSGSKQVEIGQLPPGEKFKHTLQIVPQSVGTWVLTIFNFSYRDGFGKTQRIKELSKQINVREALPLPPKAEIDVKLNPTELYLREWGELKGQVTNIGKIAVESIKVQVTGKVEGHEDVSLGRLSAGETVNFSLRVRPLESGTDVPISIDINYIDQVKRTYNRIISKSLRVINKDKDKPTVHYDFSGAKIGGGVAHGDYTGDVIHNTTPQRNLAETAAEIQQLLKQLSQTYPTSTSKEKMAVVAEAVDQIESNPTLKARVLNSLKVGGKEAFKEAINHPLVNILMATIEGWQEAE